MISTDLLFTVYCSRSFFSRRPFYNPASCSQLLRPPRLESHGHLLLDSIGPDADHFAVPIERRELSAVGYRDPNHDSHSSGPLEVAEPCLERRQAVGSHGRRHDRAGVQLPNPHGELGGIGQEIDLVEHDYQGRSERSSSPSTPSTTRICSSHSGWLASTT